LFSTMRIFSLVLEFSFFFREDYSDVTVLIDS